MRTKTKVTPNPDGNITTDSTVQASAARVSTPFLYTGAVSGSNVSGHTGVRADIDVVKLGTGAYMKAVWIAMYHTSNTGSHSQWTQWGYALHKAYGYINILTTWQFDGGTTQIFPATTILASNNLEFGTQPTFSLEYISGTTWRAARNGVELYEMDLDTASLTKVEFFIETQDGTVRTTWPEINVRNFSTKASGVWTPLPVGRYGGNGVNGLSIWPESGNIQDPSIPDAGLKLGGRKNSQVSTSATLWS